MLNWRLCNYKCVSNTIWLNIDLFLRFKSKAKMFLKSYAPQKDIKLSISSNSHFFIFLRRIGLYFRPVEVVGHCKSFQLLELVV